MYFLEELRHCLRIETGVVHDIAAEQIGFFLRLAGVFQKVGAHAERNTQLRHLRQGASPKNPAQDGERQLCGHLLGGGPSPVALHDVGNLVGHHAG